MKRLPVLLLALTLLTACAGQNSAPAPSEPSAPPEASAAQPADPLQERIALELSQAAKRLETRSFIPEETGARLAACGVSFDVSDILLREDGTLSFALSLAREDGAALTLPLTGQLWYDVFDQEYEGNIVHNVIVEWGGVNLADGDTLCVSTLDALSFYNAETLAQEKAPAFDLSRFDGETCYLLAAAVDEAQNGFAVAYATEREEGFLLYDAEGALRGAYPIPYREQDSSERKFYSDRYNTSATKPHFLFLPQELDVLDADGPMLLATARWGEALYLRPESGEWYEGYRLLCAEQDGWRAVMTNYSRAYLGYQPRSDVTQLALLWEGDRLQGWIDVKGENLSENFNLDPAQLGLSPEEATQITLDPQKRLVTAVSPLVDMTLTLDFAAREATIGYDIQWEHMNGPLTETSADGRYSLGTSSFLGAGDYGTSNLVLRDNVTKEYRFVATTGGMYGGYGNMGFFKNSDVYVQDLTSLRVFSPERPQDGPFFRLEDHFPLGALPEEQVTRLLFTFRRDPNDLTWLVVYADGPLVGGWNWQEVDYRYRADATYRIGVCDASGRLLESWDTGERVASTNFGMAGVSMRVKGELVAIYSPDGKGGGDFAGVFDRASQSYTPATMEGLREQGFASVY